MKISIRHTILLVAVQLMASMSYAQVGPLPVELGNPSTWDRQFLENLYSKADVKATVNDFEGFNWFGDSSEFWPEYIRTSREYWLDNLRYSDTLSLYKNKVSCSEAYGYTPTTLFPTVLFYQKYFDSQTHQQLFKLQPQRILHSTVCQGLKSPTDNKTPVPGPWIPHHEFVASVPSDFVNQVTPYMNLSRDFGHDDGTWQPARRTIKMSNGVYIFQGASTFVPYPIQIPAFSEVFGMKKDEPNFTNQIQRNVVGVYSDMEAPIDSTFKKYKDVLVYKIRQTETAKDFGIFVCYKPKTFYCYASGHTKGPIHPRWNLGKTQGWLFNVVTAGEDEESARNYMKMAMVENESACQYTNKVHRGEEYPYHGDESRCFGPDNFAKLPIRCSESYEQLGLRGWSCDSKGVREQKCSWEQL